jgi:hypothetical protein
VQVKKVVMEVAVLSGVQGLSSPGAHLSDPEMVDAFVDFWVQSINVDDDSSHVHFKTKSKDHGSRSLTEMRQAMKVR